MQAKRLTRVAWGLSAVVTALSVLVWLDANNGRINTHAYALFPVFGLIAFSLMWVHYIVGATRRFYGLSKKHFTQYYGTTSFVVLFALLLHPGLLIAQLWRSGFGLPPDSYLNYYVAPAARWAVMLGSISLLVFLAFELRHKFAAKSWWKWFERVQVAAMAMIFIHALRLGGELQVGWFRVIWLLYGISFVLAVGYIFYKDAKRLEVKK